MKRFIEGRDRSQRILLPEQRDGYVADSNPVRVVDVFVDELDLVQTGFEGTMPAQTGRRPITHRFFSRYTTTAISSNFKAVNNRGRNFTSAKLQRHMEENPACIERYLSSLDTAGRQKPERRQVAATRLHENIATKEIAMPIESNRPP